MDRIQTAGGTVTMSSLKILRTEVYGLKILYIVCSAHFKIKQISKDNILFIECKTTNRIRLRVGR